MPKTSPAELHQRGVAAINRGHFQRAQALLTQALELAVEPDLLARVNASLAYTQAELGDRQGALERCAAAMRIEGLSPRARAIVRSQQAVLMSRGGDLAAVIGLFDLALPALTPASTERANALVNRGIAHLELGKLDLANDDFVGATADYLADDNLEGAASAEHNSGYVHLLQGDLVGALEMMERAEAGLTSAGLQVRTIGIQDRAEVLLSAGMTRDAVELLEQAVTNFTKLRLPRMRAECEVMLGRALLWLDPAKSRTLARAAARRLRRHGNDTWALRADTLELIAESTSGRNNPNWLSTAEELSAQLRTHLLAHEAQLLDLNAARVAVAVGDLTVASELLVRGRPTATDSLAERLLECRAKADLALAQGRQLEALRQLRCGLDLLHDWQSSFGSLDLMSSVVGHGRSLATTGIQLAIADGSPELVFEWSERARALTTRVVPVRPPRDEQLAADLIEIRTLTSVEPAAGTSEAERLGELRERVRKRSWLGAGSGEVNRIASVDELVEALGPDVALVSYLWDGQSRLTAIVLTDQAQQVVELGESEPVRHLIAGLAADLDMNASDLSVTMAQVIRESLDRRLADIAAALVDPILSQLGDRRVVITQAGILAGVPWSMLAGYRGRPLTIAFTASGWLQTRGLDSPVTLGLVAGPQVSRAVEEVELSATCWTEATVLTDARATTAAVQDLAAKVDLLHISAHGRHSAENPLFSGVLLADGPLFGYDLDQLTTVPQVVILSACEVGRSTQRWAEESLGMVNAWLHAGARCVIASPAAVADDEACEVLSHVHRLMAAGAAPAVALAEATSDRPTSFLAFGAGW